MPPSQAAATLGSLWTLKSSPHLPELVRNKAKLFSDALRNHGLDTGLSSGSAVVPVLTGSSPTAVKLSQMLRENNIIAYAVFYPVVAINMARVRFFISAAHTDDDLLQTANIVAECSRAIGII
jgi:8-amino-7-oxononanoate synthase